IVVIGGNGPVEVAPAREEVAPPPRVQAGTTRSANVRATPLVRRIAAELGIDLETVAGTGPQGRLTEADVRAAAGGGPQPVEGERREPIRGVKRQMFEHLTRAHREIPPVTWLEECDYTEADVKRLVPLALKAAAESLKEYPELNA